MVFEPTFEELGRRSAELATGGDPDANLPVTDEDLDDQDAPAAEGATTDAAGAEIDGALAAGDVRANDLPPYGNE